MLKTPRYFLQHVKHFGKGNIKAGENNLIWIPFHTTWSCLSGQRTLWDAVANIGGNLLGFVPMGIMLPILFRQLNTGKKIMAAIFIVSACFELTQFIIGVGYCDIDDLIQNTLGGAMGFWMYKKWIKEKLVV